MFTRFKPTNIPKGISGDIGNLFNNLKQKYGQWLVASLALQQCVNESHEPNPKEY